MNTPIVTSRRASILVLILWIIFFLSSITLVAAYYVRHTISITGRCLQGHASLYIADAGTIIALEALAVDARDYDSLDEPWCSDFLDGTLPRIHTYEDVEGRAGGVFKAVVRDEASKLPVNHVDRDTLARFFAQVTPAGFDAEGVADSVIARRDQKAGGFDSIYDLAQASGMTAAAFFGEDTNANGFLDPWEDDGDRNLPVDDADGTLDVGLKESITVWGAGSINMNTAPFEVIASLPGIDAQAARAIIEARNRTPFKRSDDVSLVPGLSQAARQALGRWAAVSSDFFTVAVSARAAASTFERHATAVIDRSASEPVFIRWRQD